MTWREICVWPYLRKCSNALLRSASSEMMSVGVSGSAAALAGEEDDEGPAMAPAEGSPRCDCSAASVELGSEVLTRGRAAVQKGL